ncbi:unnamed protein product [Penicillium pancosmium]
MVHDMPSSPKCLSLLLINHQLSTETRAVLDRGKLDYVVEIAVKNELDLFLTWQSVPRLATHISSLYTNVRLFGPIIDSRTIGGQLGDGGRRGFHRSFFAALERFLRYGPVREMPQQRERGSSVFRHRKALEKFEDRSMLIDTLVMDFQSADLELNFPPDNVTFRHWKQRHNGLDRFPSRSSGEILKTLSSYKPRPEWLCGYLHQWVIDLLSMGYQVSSFGKPLYDHIGTIQMLVDGRLQFKIDLSSHLAGRRCTDAGSMMGHLNYEDRKTEFWKWKTETLLRRETQGFPVVRPSEDEWMHELSQ